LRLRRVLPLLLRAAAILAAASAIAPAEPNSTGSEPGVLLLKSGRLVHGRISESSGGFVVDLKNGRMLVPFNQVRMHAASAEEVYYKLRKTVPEGSVNYRLSLATWCLNNKLYNQARNEVRDVLKADPQNPTAGRMLKRIDALLDTKHDDSSQQRPSLAERLLAPEAKSLAGLSPNVAAAFVSRVQPILMNGCALAGCHGPRAKNDFVLLRVHLTSGSRRGQSERNLAAALRYVDVRRPESSPLLEKPKGNHGRRGRTIFRGRGGARQLEAIRNWVRMVANDSRTPADPRNFPKSRGSGSQPARSSMTARAIGDPVVTPQLRDGFGNGIPKPDFQLTPAMRAARSRLRREANARGRKPPIRRKAKRGDPFDPEEFNRQTALGQSGKRKAEGGQ
jgi:hypothetical protein